MCLGGLAAILVAPPLAGAYTFAQPFVHQAGTDNVVFDWSVQKCEDNDITDEPARAFRDDTGKVQLVTSHFVNRRFIGPTIDSLTHPCTKTMSSTGNSDPSKYDGREWVASPWTPDGKNIYALVHNEYSGQLYDPNGYCLFSGESQSDRYKCWYNSITSVYSTDSGATYQQLPAPSHLVATIPYQYAKDGPNGFFLPSNIVRSGDGYFYAFIRAEDKGFQQLGSCLIRTRNVGDPASWRAWSGSGFTVAFQNPYVGTFDPAQHVCTPVDLTNIGNMTESLTYNTYLRKWMLVGASVGAAQYNRPPGFYYALSDDLVHWSLAELLMETELTFSRDCVNPPYPLRDPALIDPNSTSRNYETVGQTAYLFYTEYHNNGCSSTLDRDLRRVPIEFSNQAPGGPAAALAASPTSAAVGDSVQFDASGSTDADGTVQSYRWDLDGDGTFERDTGSSPVTSKAYTAPEQVTVTVRVSDNDGKSTDETEIVKVAGNSSSPAVCRQVTWKKKQPCRSAR